MGTLEFACIAPHGSPLLPFLVSGAEKSVAAMAELGRRMSAAKPDLVVVMTPHGLRVEGQFCLYDSARLSGAVKGEGGEGETRHGMELEFDCDRDFVRALSEAAKARGLPAARVRPDIQAEPLQADFGVTIPLWHLAAAMRPQPKLCALCSDRGNMDWKHFTELGRALATAISGYTGRVAFVASADLGHAHDPRHAFGYDPASAEFDRFVAERIAAQDLAAFAGIDLAWMQRAKTDAYGQLLVLASLLESVSQASGQSFRGEVLSYEVTGYFGMLSAAFGKA